MELETAQGLAHERVTEAELLQAFADDARRGEFIILSQSEQVYIQASGEGEGPYLMEYRDGSAERHYQCRQDLSKADVQAAFVSCFRGDGAWKVDWQWEPLAGKPWWKFW